MRPSSTTLKTITFVAVLAPIATAAGLYIFDHLASKQAISEAWSVITSQEGKKTSGGRMEALQDLNEWGEDLSGTAAPSAFLAGVTSGAAAYDG